MQRALTSLVFAAALVLAPAAAAHVTANPGEAPAGAFAVVSFRVPHGCEDAATTSLSVQIPAGVSSVAPQAVPGWEVSTTTGELPEPIESEGETITEGITAVTWTGGPLDPHQYTDFGISMRMPDRPGETIWFPAIQRCGAAVTRWITIPEDGQPEPDTPAPGVELIASTGGEHGGGGAAMEEPGAETTADEPAAEDEETAPAAAAASDDDDRDALALTLGAAGLAAGLLALGLTLSRRPRRT